MSATSHSFIFFSCLQLQLSLLIFVMSLIGLCLDSMQVFSLGLGPIMLFLAPEEG